MTKHDLKELAAMGAELGAAKAEVERLRGLLEAALYYVPSNKTELRALIDAAIEHSCKNCEGVQPESCMFAKQAEPTANYTAVDMATAAAQGFRDGQGAVEQAVVQDERKTFEVEIPDISAIYDGRSFIPYRSLEAGERLMTVAQHLRIETQLRAALTRPAQTEQQPVGHVYTMQPCFPGEPMRAHAQLHVALPAGTKLYAAPIAQTAPQGKFRMGDLVKKSTGSEWEGRVVGWYSTEQTPEGYAVESSAHRNSVQIYPAKALEAVDV